jgi:hypothetical protein
MGSLDDYEKIIVHQEVFCSRRGASGEVMQEPICTPLNRFRDFQG